MGERLVGVAAGLRDRVGEPVESADEAVVITDAPLDPPGPVIRYVNAHFEGFTGYPAAELLGRTPRILQGERTDRAELDRLRRELDERRSFIGATMNYRRDGTAYLNEWIVLPVLGLLQLRRAVDLFTPDPLVIAGRPVSAAEAPGLWRLLDDQRTCSGTGIVSRCRCGGWCA